MDTPIEMSNITRMPDNERLDKIARAYGRVIEKYVPGRYAGGVTVFISEEGPIKLVTDPTFGWGRVAAEVKIIKVPGNHITCITTHVKVLAEHLRHCIEAVEV